MADDATPLLSRRDGAVLTLTLNRPQALNSFDGALHEALIGALKAAAGDAGVRCVVITGAGRGFCAGQDLSDPAIAPDLTPGAAPKDIGKLIEERYKPLALAIHHFPVPVIAAVNGVAAGAGALFTVLMKNNERTLTTFDPMRTREQANQLYSGAYSMGTAATMMAIAEALRDPIAFADLAADGDGHPLRLLRADVRRDRRALLVVLALLLVERGAAGQGQNEQVQNSRQGCSGRNSRGHCCFGNVPAGAPCRKGAVSRVRPAGRR